MTTPDPFRTPVPGPFPNGGNGPGGVAPPGNTPPAYPLSAYGQVPYGNQPNAAYPQPTYPQPVAAPQPYGAPHPLPVPQPLAAPRPMPVPVPAPSITSAPAPRPAPVPLRPQPVRPVPVPVKPAMLAGGIPQVQDRPLSDEEQPDTSEKVVRSAPPWMVSAIVHMVLVVIMALMTYARPLQDTVITIDSNPVYAEKLGEQVLDDKLQSPEALEMNITDPALAFADNPADNPLAAPPMIDVNLLDANKGTSDVAAPTIGLALSGREAGSKKALLAAYGGTATTEASVRLGLEWLKKNQLKDGAWSLTGPYEGGAVNENRVAATAMALLAFQGAGHTHLQGDFKNEVKKGWEALLKLQNADGFFDGEAPHHQRLYAQAQATIALCEIYGMTKDEKFKGPAQKAVDFANRAQSREGGWRYEPRDDADTSVTGWYVIALQSATMAGLQTQSPTLDKISTFLDSVGHEDQTRYSYQPTKLPDVTMTAEALLCRQYLGWKHKDPRLKNGCDYLLRHPIDYATDHNVYYWYYATQTLHHMDGPEWNEWNSVMRQAVPEHQTKSGNEKGSWSSAEDRWGIGGRMYTTCLSIYMLEVYYRHLPIYKYRLQ